jgi:hypothetical protein
VDGFLENELVFGRVKFTLEGSKILFYFDNFFPKRINGTNISYIMSYMTCEYKHDAIKPLIPNQNINLEVLDSPSYINSSTKKFNTFLT